MISYLSIDPFMRLMGTVSSRKVVTIGETLKRSEQSPTDLCNASSIDISVNVEPVVKGGTPPESFPGPLRRRGVPVRRHHGLDQSRQRTERTHRCRA